MFFYCTAAFFGHRPVDWLSLEISVNSKKHFMNATQIHLVFNHAPVFFSITGALMLLTGLAISSRPVQNAALSLIVIAALAIIPVYLTGEGAEEAVEQLGVSEALVESHEELAKASLFIMQLAGAAAALAILSVYYRAKLARAFTIASLVISLFAFGFIAQTAHLGGKIRHTELAGSSAGAEAQTNEHPGNDD
jgi:uncharacterized membrane protein